MTAVDDPFGPPTKATGIESGTGVFGAPTWSVELGDDSAQGGTANSLTVVAHDDDTVVLAPSLRPDDQPTMMYARAVRDGTPTWAGQLVASKQSTAFYGHSVLDGMSLYTQLSDNGVTKVAGIDLRNGKVVSCSTSSHPGLALDLFSAGGLPYEIYRKPNTTEATVYRLGPSGPLWSRLGEYDSVLGASDTTVVVGSLMRDDALYRSQDAKLAGLNVRTGEVRWETTMRELTTGLPSVDGATPDWTPPTQGGGVASSVVGIAVRYGSGWGQPGATGAADGETVVAFSWSPIDVTRATPAGPAWAQYSLTVAADTGKVVSGAAVQHTASPPLLGSAGALWLPPTPPGGPRPTWSVLQGDTLVPVADAEGACPSVDGATLLLALVTNETSWDGGAAFTVGGQVGTTPSTSARCGDGPTAGGALSGSMYVAVLRPRSAVGTAPAPFRLIGYPVDRPRAARPSTSTQPQPRPTPSPKTRDSGGPSAA